MPVIDSTHSDKKARVLVVDDNRDLAKMLSMLVRHCGYEVRVAHDGQSALEVARDYRPQVVLLDIGLPGLDGYEVARRLRQQDGFEHTRLVALTGYSQEEDRVRSEQAGIDHHLVKPVPIATLQKLLRDEPDLRAS